MHDALTLARIPCEHVSVSGVVVVLVVLMGLSTRRGGGGGGGGGGEGEGGRGGRARECRDAGKNRREGERPKKNDGNLEKRTLTEKRRK